jgi:hypothetical protein
MLFAALQYVFFKQQPTAIALEIGWERFKFRVDGTRCAMRSLCSSFFAKAI